MITTGWLDRTADKLALLRRAIEKHKGDFSKIAPLFPGTTRDAIRASANRHGLLSKYAADAASRAAKKTAPEAGGDSSSTSSDSDHLEDGAYGDENEQHAAPARSSATSTAAASGKARASSKPSSSAAKRVLAVPDSSSSSASEWTDGEKEHLQQLLLSEGGDNWQALAWALGGKHTVEECRSMANALSLQLRTFKSKPEVAAVVSAATAAAKTPQSVHPAFSAQIIPAVVHSRAASGTASAPATVTEKTRTQPAPATPPTDMPSFKKALISQIASK